MVSRLLITLVAFLVLATPFYLSPGTAAARTARTVLFAFFCGLFFVGGYWDWVRLTLELRAMSSGAAMPPMIPLWKIHVSPTLDYKLNGLVFASVLFVLVVLFQGIRRRLGRNTLWAAGALVYAFLLSLLFHSGFVVLSAS